MIGPKVFSQGTEIEPLHSRAWNFCDWYDEQLLLDEKKKELHASWSLPQRTLSQSLTLPASIYLWLPSRDATCFFGHVFPHIMGGISLSAEFHHFDLFKACQIYYSYRPCLRCKIKENKIEKNCSNHPCRQQFFAHVFIFYL